MQTAHALSEGRVIFTQDEDFLAIHASGTPQVAGLPARWDYRGANNDGSTGFRTLNSMTSSFRLNPKLFMSIFAAVLMPPKFS